MKVAEFIRLSAEEMDEYLNQALPTFSLLNSGRNIYDFLDLEDFKKARMGQKKKLIKKRDQPAEGLGGILPSSSLDLTFYDINGRPVGNLWRYGNGVAAFSSSIIRQKTTATGRVENVLEMLKIARGDETN
jgi:hypothetical protein